jgi:hypothetical protein
MSNTQQVLGVSVLQSQVFKIGLNDEKFVKNIMEIINDEFQDDSEFLS